LHPGVVLEQEYLRPLGISRSAAARALNVPVTRISEIVRGRRAVTADTALRLARFLGTGPELWLGLQAEYDLRVARSEGGGAIQRSIAPWRMR
jgi:addiction module HigA family antidote